MNTKFVIATAMSGLCLFACTAHVDSSSPGVVPTIPSVGQKIPSPAGGCPNFSGNYTMSGLATLAVTQTDCASITLNQQCSNPMCDGLGVPTSTVTLPLDGSVVTTTEDGASVQYQASFNGSSLVETRTAAGEVSTRTMVMSDHPCDPANPSAGIEAQVSDVQGPATVTSCQPWSK